MTDSRRPTETEEIHLVSSIDEDHHERSSSWIDFITDTWTLDFLTWVLGAIGLSTIIALSAAFHDKPLSDWRASISINTVVSVLSQMIQSALLLTLSECIGQLKWLWYRKSHPAYDFQVFDSASRGPLGSLILLWRLRGKHLVSLGALATACMMMVSPFTQEAFKADAVRTVPQTNAQASMPRCISYRVPPKDLNGYIRNENTGATSGNIPLPEVNGMIAYSFSSQRETLVSVANTCLTGNCTWEPYVTLAVCYSVEDISSKVIKTCPSESCFYNVPGKQTYPSNLTYEGYKNLIVTSNVDYSDKSTLVDFNVLYETNLTGLYDPDKSQHANVAALKCILKLCLQSMQSTTTNGLTTTEILKSESDVDWENSDGGVQTTWDNVTYSLERYSLKSLRDQLALRVFNGTACTGSRIGGDSYYTSDTMRVIAGDLYDSEFGVNDMTKRLQNLSVGITNVFRASNQISAVNGTTFAAEQYIQTDFRWLIAPVFLYLATTIFFMATWYRSRKARLLVWKSSQIAGLCSTDLQGQLGLVSDMERQAEQTLVQLKAEPSNETWYLEKKRIVA